MPEILSNEQIEAYREMGYLVLERHLPDDILIKIRAVSYTHLTLPTN